MSYDAAMTQVNINSSNLIPKEFVANKVVNIVYDNIGFGEEIHKQTRVTNGVITHRIVRKPELPETGCNDEKITTDSEST